MKPNECTVQVPHVASDVIKYVGMQDKTWIEDDDASLERIRRQRALGGMFAGRLGFCGNSAEALV